MIEGQTTDKGVIEMVVPKDATHATLYIDDEVYELDLVDDQPTKSIEWSQARLNNLGFDCGSIDGQWGPRSQAAMKLFQLEYGLGPTGRRDKESLDVLKKAHDQEDEEAGREEYEPEANDSDEVPEEQTSDETMEDDDNESDYPEDDPSYFE